MEEELARLKKELFRPNQDKPSQSRQVPRFSQTGEVERVQQLVAEESAYGDYDSQRERGKKPPQHLGLAFDMKRYS